VLKLRGLPGWRLTAWAGLALAACSAPAPDDSGPVELVQALYGEEQLWLEGRDSLAYFTPDLSDALIEDGSDPELVGAVNFDYRFGSQDGAITGLRFESLNRAPGLVAASFEHEGDPRTVIWTLCQRDDGAWRIADAAREDSDDPWSLRTLLNLQVAPPVC
jgi:hypothetical protein